MELKKRLMSACVGVQSYACKLVPSDANLFPHDSGVNTAYSFRLVNKILLTPNRFNGVKPIQNRVKNGKSGERRISSLPSNLGFQRDSHKLSVFFSIF
jgi:hypothetical protein